MQAGRLTVATGALLALAACGRGAPEPRPAPTASAAEAPVAAPSPPPSDIGETPSLTPSLVPPVEPTPRAAPGDDDSSLSIDAPAALPTLSLPLPDMTLVPRASSSPAPPAKPAPVTEQSFAPRDECSRLPGWPAFRDKLARAVADKDVRAFAALAAHDVKLDYGGGSGRRELRERLGDPARGLWRELAQILPLGCSDANGILALPWYFWNLPIDIDPHAAMLVTGDAVPLRAKPDPDARVLATLDWPVVALPPGKFDPAARYTPVRTRAGKLDGYVLTAKLRSVLAYRLVAERQGSDWKLTAFIAGD
ncbi:MAG: hypothetical protein KGL48_15930 [Sphingomonadales bacterium]|nr:hypothetical protein [Sphingomonadales bacterium]MDE2569090.1 hypothetical protein [Sphingomonadales bacterium]